ncbi:MAG: glutamine synthetase type III, partial [Clostridia bacterium]|nr:glutamine synthetase type III [Clostridia bacterium]
VAESLCRYADILENAENFTEELHTLIQSIIKDHKRIIFNGNGYDDKWIKEAVEVRGLSNLRTTPEAVERYTDPKNIELFKKHKIFTEAEVYSRREIKLEAYCKTINIEALTMIEMARKEILPAMEAYTLRIANTGNSKRTLMPDVDCSYEEKIVKRLTSLILTIDEGVCELEEAVARVRKIEDVLKRAYAYKDDVVTLMEKIREAADEGESLTAKKYWPYPVYEDLLFGVKQ